ncbi:transcriptional regulator [Actinomadura sp. NPDC047616]|uniref:transcriptional regulator n=1 Tax=Actinomadura sp. NPDC047616 TaxID=3155914 RepID=UPI0033EE41DA
MNASPAVFAAVFVALYVAHEVGDHWVQSSGQALGKGAAGWPGRWACLRHVATLTATKLITLGLALAVLDLALSPWAVAAGLTVDAASHYWADRRTTLRALAEKVGKGEFADLGDGVAAPAGTGAYALDQSWHIGWLFIAALISCIGGAA